MTRQGDADRLIVLAALLQIADSAFPAGGYVESSGIEALVRGGDITDQSNLRDVLTAYRVMSVDRCDVWFARHAQIVVADDEFSALAALAHREHVCRPTALQRRTSARLGAALLNRVCDAFADSVEEASLRSVRTALPDVQPLSTTAGAVVAALGGTSDDAAKLVTYLTLSSMAAATVRLGAVGSFQANAALSDALRQPAPPSLASHPTTAAPLFDIATMIHEVAPMTSFAS